MSSTRKIPVGLAWHAAGLAVLAWQLTGTAAELAAGNEVMRNWRVDDGKGLPSDSVTAITQSRDGFLWVGTSAGLVRFDGVKFTASRLTAANESARITALCEDSNGYLWIGTQQQGLFELEQGQIHHWGERQGLCDANVTSLDADNRGQVWIGTRSGLNLWNGKHLKSFTTHDGLPAEFVSGVNVARSGTVWITTRSGMCRYVDGHIGAYTFETESQGRSPEYLGAYEDRRGNLWAFGDTYLINLTEGKRFNYFRSSESTSVRIWSLCEGQDGRLWIGTSGRGLYWFDENRFQEVTLAEERWPSDVRAICEDQNGNLWLGTASGGLVQLRRQSIHLLGADQGLPASAPTALALDPKGRLFVGLQRGGLVAGEEGHFDRAGGVGTSLEGCVSSVCVAGDGTIWTGTLGNGLYGLRNGRAVRLTTADGLADDMVLAVCAEAGGLWFSTRAGPLQHLSTSNCWRIETVPGSPPATITVIMPAAAGGLWLGAENGQVGKYAHGKFELLPQGADAGRHPVLALYESEPGTLWIGSNGGGLRCLRNGVAQNWNVAGGLPSDVVAGIIGDSAKNLWLSTSAGVYRIKSADLAQLENGGGPLVCELMASARTSPEPTWLAGGARAAGSPEGLLWFATSEGLLCADTLEPKKESQDLRMCLESAAFNGQSPASLLQGPVWSVSGTGQAPRRAPTEVRSLELRFTALNFDNPEEMHFRHKLEGLDPDWVDGGGARVVRYGRLAYGPYRFHLAARRTDGQWEESTQSFAFLVPTPLYYQNWAIGLYGLTAIGLVAGTVRVVSHRRLRSALARLEQQQLLERERLRIARDMHDEMGSKLTKISFLSERVQVDTKASDGPLGQKIETIAQTSRELLKTMDEIVWVVNPHNDTLENLTAYLSHYAAEYFQNTNIECELSLPQELPHIPLSSETRHNLFLAFEEALNNVLKHSGATVVRAAMTKEGSDFRLTIADNGKGFDPAALTAPGAEGRGQRAGNGMRNMRQRLETLGGDCQVSSRPGSGTTVTLRIGISSKIQL